MSARFRCPLFCRRRQAGRELHANRHASHKCEVCVGGWLHIYFLSNGAPALPPSPPLPKISLQEQPFFLHCVRSVRSWVGAKRRLQSAAHFHLCCCCSPCARIANIWGRQPCFVSSRMGQLCCFDAKLMQVFHLIKKKKKILALEITGGVTVALAACLILSIYYLLKRSLLSPSTAAVKFPLRY